MSMPQVVHHFVCDKFLFLTLLALCLVTAAPNDPEAEEDRLSSKDLFEDSDSDSNSDSNSDDDSSNEDNLEGVEDAS